MKKVLGILFVILICCGCSQKVNYTYDIQYRDVDMSAYKGVSSTDHNFKEINVSELYNCIDNESSGLFYLGRSNCGCCQKCVKYINEAAKSLNVIVYYLDVYNEEMPINTDEEIAKITEYLKDAIDPTDNEEMQLQTPTVFSIINGKVYDFNVCTYGYSEDKMTKRYKEIFKPFAH